MGSDFLLVVVLMILLRYVCHLPEDDIYGHVSTNCSLIFKYLDFDSICMDCRNLPAVLGVSKH